MPSSRQPLTADSLAVLDAVATPVWLFSCTSSKLLWGNAACLKFFNRSLEQLTAYRFATGTDSTLAGLNKIVKEGVELGGTEATLPGDKVPLPGVIPGVEIAPGTQFLYKQAILELPQVEARLCTLVQMLSPPAAPTPSPDMRGTATVKTYSRSGRMSGDGRVGRAGAVTIPAIMDMVDSVLNGQPVPLDVVEGLQSMLARGEIVVQSTRISEELLVKEQLDQDVGLNLLQLLGSRYTPPAAAMPDGQQDGLASSSTTSCSSSTSSQGSPSSKLSSGDVSSSSTTSDATTTAVRRQTSRVSVSSVEDNEDSQQCVVSASLMPAMEAALATADEWRFDAFKLAEATQGHPMSALAFWLMKRQGLIEQLQLDANCLARFLRKVEDSYPDNPYHNKVHAADVLQSMHVLMTRGGLVARLGEEHNMCYLAGYLAAIVHDNEHKGLNNDYLVRMSDDLAVTYNDVSPMENHHVAAAFRLMRSHECNFARKLPRDKMARLRRLLIDMVLATDMKQHFNILQRFQAKMQVKQRSSGASGQQGGGASNSFVRMNASEDPLPMEDEADRSLVLQVALKAADVGHLAAPWDVHHRWVRGLEEEFFRQGDKEKAARVPVSSLMDRCRDGITKSQVGFFDVVALPLFYTWAAVFYEAMPLVRAVEDNCSRWRAIEARRTTHPSK